MIQFFHRFENHINFTDTKMLIDSSQYIILYERISEIGKIAKIKYIELSINCQDFEE